MVFWLPIKSTDVEIPENSDPDSDEERDNGQTVFALDLSTAVIQKIFKSDGNAFEAFSIRDDVLYTNDPERKNVFTLPDGELIYQEEYDDEHYGHDFEHFFSYIDGRCYIMKECHHEENGTMEYRIDLPEFKQNIISRHEANYRRFSSKIVAESLVTLVREGEGSSSSIKLSVIPLTLDCQEPEERQKLIVDNLEARWVHFEGGFTHTSSKALFYFCDGDSPYNYNLKKLVLIDFDV